MRLAALAAMFALPGLAANAAPICDARGVATVFHCAIEDSTREVTVCDLADSGYLYVYGRPGRPELELRRGPREVVYTPWNGIGGSWWAQLGFANGDYFYNVGYSRQKGPDDHPTYGQVEIFQGAGRDAPVAVRTCRVGTVFTRLDDLWDRFD